MSERRERPLARPVVRTHRSVARMTLPVSRSDRTGICTRVECAPQRSGLGSCSRWERRSGGGALGHYYREASPPRRRVAKRRAKTPKMTPGCQAQLRHSQQVGAFRIRNCKVAEPRTPGSSPRRTSHNHDAAGHGTHPRGGRVGRNPAGGDEAVDWNEVLHYPGRRDPGAIECTQNIYRELGSVHLIRERYDVSEVARIH